MKLFHRMILTALFGLSACAAPNYEAPLIVDDGALQLVIQAEKPVQPLSSTLVLLAQIQNVSQNDRFFYARSSSGVPFYEVTGPDGKKVEVGYAIDDPPPPGREDFVLIEAGNSLNRRFRVHLAPDPPLSPGSYQMTAVYKVTEHSFYDPETRQRIPMSGWTGTLRSNTLTLELTE